MKEKNSGIYKITNQVNGKVYIGSSKWIERRYGTHKNELDKNKHINNYLQKDWNEFGSENFKLEIIESVEDPHNMPEREAYYINLYSKEKGVYNISDPRYEFIKGREEKIIVDKGKNRGKKSSEYKLTKEYIVQWLIDNFQEVLIKLREKIKKDQYMEKSKMDKWFMNNIKDEDIKSDDRIEGLINKMYNKLGYNIVDGHMYSYQLYKLGVNIGKDVRLILVESKLSRILYESKYQRKNT